jgi:hypothetical protein
VEAAKRWVQRTTTSMISWREKSQKTAAWCMPNMIDHVLNSRIDARTEDYEGHGTYQQHWKSRKRLGNLEQGTWVWL